MQKPSEATTTQGFLSESTEVAPTTPAEPTGAEEQKPSADEAGPGPSAEETTEEAPKKEPEAAAPLADFIIKGETVDDEYGVLDHPAIKPNLERWQRRESSRLEEEYGGRLREETKNWEATQTYQTLSGYLGRIMQKLQEGEVEPTEKLINGLAAAAEPMKETFIKVLQQGGAKAERTSALDELTSTLGRRGQDEFEDYYNTTRNLTWKNVIERFLSLREAGAKKPLQDEATSLKAENEGLKERIRTGKGPDLTPKGGARGNDNELLLDPDTPIEVITEIQARQTGG